MMRSGIVHYRLEFVHEAGDTVRQVCAAFNAYFQGNLDSAGLDRRLQKVVPQGTTEGSLFVPDDYLRVPVIQP